MRAAVDERESLEPPHDRAKLQRSSRADDFSRERDVRLEGLAIGAETCGARRILQRRGERTCGRSLFRSERAQDLRLLPVHEPREAERGRSLLAECRRLLACDAPQLRDACHGDIPEECQRHVQIRCRHRAAARVSHCLSGRMLDRAALGLIGPEREWPKLRVQNMYAPLDGTTPTAYGIALSIGEHFSRIFENPYATPKIEGVELNFDLVPDRRSARLETARTDVTEARPGDEITIETLLRPYRGESILRQIPMKIPTSTPKGTLRILVSDGDTLDKMRRVSGPMSRRLDLGSTIALLNKEHTNSELYVSLLEANPQAMVDDKVMPTLPLSVMNVMDGMRGTQDMIVVGESAVDEASTPVDYVVTGSQIITLTIK